MSLFKTSKVEEVLVELYTSLFKTSKVEEEMVKQFGNIRPLANNPDLCRVLEVTNGILAGLDGI